MMKQVNIHGPGKVQLDDADSPEPGPRDAVVRVAACGVCGTDVRYVRMGGLRRPMPLGHELSGVIERRFGFLPVEVDARGITELLRADLRTWWQSRTTHGGRRWQKYSDFLSSW